MRVLWSLVLLLGLATSPRAQGLADVVIAVDGSGSMTDEAGAVESALASFAATIGASGVDVHVIVISRTGAIPQGLCVPAPLGSGACPADENLPGYRHVIDSSIGSGNVFARILATYSSWSGSLRAGASRTLVAVTDDEDAMSASSFQTQLVALDPGFAGFRFDALVGTSCPLTFPTGTQYINLAALTAGIVSDLCNPSNISAAFTTIANQVIADSTCAPSCSPVSVGNGTCDSACNVAACGFDAGDCDCAPGCPPSSIGDAMCDSACNVAACGFDAGDCPQDSSTADVIIAVDTSGSMSEEAAAIESVLASFAAEISSGGLDLHVVLISESRVSSDSGICAPAPLGSGVCPADESLPGYRHVVQGIESGGALAAILASHASWSASLRPGASRTVIVVSDDEDDLAAATFHTGLLALEPGFQAYHFHALVHATCPVIGTQYLTLAALTSGIVKDLCSQDAGAALQQIAPEIVADTGVEIPTVSHVGLALLGSMLTIALVLLANRRKSAR